MSGQSQGHEVRIIDGHLISGNESARDAREEAEKKLSAEALDLQSSRASLSKPLAKGYDREEAEALSKNDQTALYSLMYGLSANGGTQYWFGRNVGKWDKNHDGLLTQRELDNAPIDGTSNLYDAALLKALRKDVLAIENLSNDQIGSETGISAKDIERLEAVRESRVKLDELSQLDRRTALDFNINLATAQTELSRKSLRDVMADESVTRLREALTFPRNSSAEGLQIVLSRTPDELRAMDRSMQQNYAIRLRDFLYREMSVWPDVYQQVQAKLRQAGMSPR